MSALEREQRLVQGLFARAEDWLAQVNKHTNTQTFTVTHTYTHTDIYFWPRLRTVLSEDWLAQVKTILSSP